MRGHAVHRLAVARDRDGAETVDEGGLLFRHSHRRPAQLADRHFGIVALRCGADVPAVDARETCGVLHAGADAIAATADELTRMLERNDA